MLRKILIVLVAVFVLLVGISGYINSEIAKASDKAYQAGYGQAIKDSDSLYSDSDIEDAYYDGYRDGVSEGYDAGSDFMDINYVVDGVLEEARHYARDNSSDMSILDSMDVVSAYLDGYDPSGYPLPTRTEFENAVEVLLRYAIFLEWNTESYSSIFYAYDQFYG